MPARCPPLGIDRCDFPINDGVAGQLLAGSGNSEELPGKGVAAPGPQSDAPSVVCGDAAITVELDLVESVRPFGQVADTVRIHGFDEADFGRRRLRHAS